MFVEGGCFCGSIRYKFEANDYPSANCHCSICRRTSGAAFVSWVRVPNGCFEYISDKPKKIDSSSHGARYFCQECGTHVACFLKEDPKNINITICSLDKPQDFKPKAEIYVDDMLSWTKQ
tara:strand:- start:243 stop:602 length:360 start_codon:yes stop_codon:yes gene_type:complete